MNNPFASSDIPGMSAMGDTLSFVKNLWGNMQVPGMVAPPMSIDELDKKIQDLKTVESWLNVNMNMLRGTIQALEVQRATIATLKSLGESFAQHVQQASGVSDGATSAFAAAHAPAASSPFASNPDWPMPPGSFKTSEPVSEASAPEPIVEPEPPAEQAQTPTASKATSAKTEPETPFGNPTMWWGLLQDQFKQAVNKAMENEPLFTAGSKPEASVADQPVAPKTTRKPAGTTKTTARPAKSAAAGTIRKTAAKTPAKTSVKSSTKNSTNAPAGSDKPAAKKTSR